MIDCLYSSVFLRLIKLTLLTISLSCISFGNASAGENTELYNITGDLFHGWGGRPIGQAFVTLTKDGEFFGEYSAFEGTYNIPGMEGSPEGQRYCVEASKQGYIFDVHCFDLYASDHREDLPAVPACPGDVNRSGLVEFEDLSYVQAYWGSCHIESHCPADINGDAIVDFSDLLIVLNKWGEKGPICL